MRVHLDVVFDPRSGQAERIDSPLEIVVPVGFAEWKSLSNGGFVNLDGLDASLREIDDLVS